MKKPRQSLPLWEEVKKLESGSIGSQVVSDDELDTVASGQEVLEEVLTKEVDSI